MTEVMMTTRISKAEVVYTVSTTTVAGTWGEVWRNVVPFGLTHRYVAGGPAFIEAARQQERIAAELAEKGVG